jgi:hypothetical protein
VYTEWLKKLTPFRGVSLYYRSKRDNESFYEMEHFKNYTQNGSWICGDKTAGEFSWPFTCIQCPIPRLLLYVFVTWCCTQAKGQLHLYVSEKHFHNRSSFPPRDFMASWISAITDGVPLTFRELLRKTYLTYLRINQLQNYVYMCVCVSC